MNLNGAHVVVTGASRGIGADLARRFATRGARLSLVARSREPLETLATEVGGRAFPADLADADVVDGLIAEIEAAAGPVDVLVNNAGMGTTDLLPSTDEAEIRRTVRVNLEATIMLTRQVLPGMLARGRGHLVVMSSLAGTAGLPGFAVYGATKAGLTNFTAALRVELAGTPVGTTLVAPGPVATEMWDQVERSSDMAPALRRLRRFHLLPSCDPDELARQVVAAVEANRRHVRPGRRLAAMHWLRETPSRSIELLLKGSGAGVSG